MIDYIKETIAQNLESPTNVALFDKEKVKYLALREYDSVRDLVRVMRNRNKAYASIRSGITRALIAEAQSSDNEYWNSLLLFLYFPALAQMRFACWTNQVDDEELDQMVWSAFLEAVRNFPIFRHKRHVTQNLLALTKRRLLRDIRAIKREKNNLRAIQVYAHQAQKTDPTKSEVMSEESALDVEDAAKLLLSAVGGYEKRANLDVFVDTVIRKENLRDYLNSWYPYDADNPPARVYQRFKRQRTRTRMRLQRFFRPLYNQYLEQSDDSPSGSLSKTWMMFSSQTADI